MQIIHEALLQTYREHGCREERSLGNPLPLAVGHEIKSCGDAGKNQS